MKKFFLIDVNSSIHAQRIMSLANKLGHKMEFFKYDYVPDDPDAILVLATIDEIPEHILNRSNYKVGLSWAYDLYRIFPNQDVKFIRRANLERLDHLIVDCKHVAEIALTYGYPRSKVMIFPYGVDLDSFKYRPQPNRENNGTIHFYTNRSWEKAYGIETVLEAFNMAYASGLNFVLKLAGDGGLREVLMHQYESLFNSNYFEYLGEVSSSENRNYLNSSDFFVSASTADGFSVSILESMATGLPVIVSDIEPNKELVRDNVDGFLFLCSNPSKLCDKLFFVEKIHKDQRLLRSITDSSRKRIEAIADLRLNLNSALNHLYESTA